jgi:predicted MPP superfamily phosphohydrolase
VWWIAAIGGVAAGLLVYAWLEAGWLQAEEVEVRIPGLPPALDGLRIGHLSDFHLGAPISLGNRASERAATWVAGRRPELVCVTGDLVSHPRGARRLSRLLAGLEDPVVVLGNHDIASTRDPFSRSVELEELGQAQLLRDSATVRELRGVLVQLVGVDVSTYRQRRARPEALADPAAALRILLCHFPGIAARVSPGAFHVILSGHLHAGQIALPLPWKRLLVAHPRSRYVCGLYETPAGIMHVSAGTGTSFLPLRFFARPAVTMLVLRPGS